MDFIVPAYEGNMQEISKMCYTEVIMGSQEGR